MEIREGAIARACAGRDKDGFFVVTKIIGNYAFIADGRRRKLEFPKRKSLKHLRFTNNVIDLNGITDKKLRNVLSVYSDTVTDMGRY